MAGAADEIAAHFVHIATVFPRFDLAAFRRCFQLPCLLTTPTGALALTDDARFEEVFGGMMDDLRARGLTRSEPLRLGVHLLGERQALASVLWVRHAGDAELERLGATYTLLRGDDGEWRVNALVAHAPEAVIAFG